MPLRRLTLKIDIKLRMAPVFRSHSLSLGGDRHESLGKKPLLDVWLLGPVRQVVSIRSVVRGGMRSTTSNIEETLIALILGFDDFHTICLCRRALPVCTSKIAWIFENVYRSLYSPQASCRQAVLPGGSYDFLSLWLDIFRAVWRSPVYSTV